MECVLDASAILAWLLYGEDSSFSRIISNLVFEKKIHVPSIWPVEIANGLLTLENRDLLTETNADTLIRFVRSLPITVDAPTLSGLSAMHTLARQYHLTVHDAAYLELARRNHFALATLDKKLQRAADALRISRPRA